MLDPEVLASYLSSMHTAPGTLGTTPFFRVGGSQSKQFSVLEVVPRVLGVLDRVQGVPHRVVGVPHRVLGVLHRVLGVPHRVLGVQHRVLGRA